MLLGPWPEATWIGPWSPSSCLPFCELRTETWKRNRALTTTSSCVCFYLVPSAETNKPLAFNLFRPLIPSHPVKESAHTDSASLLRCFPKVHIRFVSFLFQVLFNNCSGRGRYKRSLCRGVLLSHLLIRFSYSLSLLLKGIVLLRHLWKGGLLMCG